MARLTRPEAKSKRGEDDGGVKAIKSVFTAAMDATMARLGLASVVLDQGWVLILRKRFDVPGPDPRHSIQLLVDAESGDYITRVWDVTVETGRLTASREAASVCEHTFDGTAACAAMFHRSNGTREGESALPFHRGLSDRCDKVYVVPSNPSAEDLQGLGFCPACRPKVECEVAWDEASLNEFAAELKTEQDVDGEEAIEAYDEGEEAEDTTLDNSDEEGFKDVEISTAADAVSGDSAKAKGSARKTRQLIVDMHLAGKSNLQIFRALKRSRVCRKTVDNVVTKYEQFGHVEDRPRSGRPKAGSAASATAKTEVRKPWQCEQCGAAFRTQKTLLDHGNTHSGEKPYACDECDFATAFESSLGLHKQAHLRKRNEPEDEQGRRTCHVCDICGATFASAYYLRYHIRHKHRGESDEVPCAECGAVFETRWQCAKHFHREHSDRFQCATCLRRFGSGNQLRRHMLTHSGPSFVCEHCGKALLKKESLRDHERIHTGERPYRCQLCGYTCMSSSTLYLHKKFKHNKTPRKKAVKPEK